MAHAFDNRTQLTPPSKEVRHQTLKQMFEKRDRLTQQTGHYCGVTRTHAARRRPDQVRTLLQ
jgi:hypothetical protein